MKPRVLAAIAIVPALFAQPGEPARFEVASIKVSTASDNLPLALHGFGRISGGPGSTTPGQYTATGISLKNLLFRDALGLNDYQYSAPAWMEKETYDVTVKVPAGITREQFRRMMGNLLIERFKMELHHEQREAATYDLVVAKGGLKMKASKFAPDTPVGPGPGSGGSLHLERDAEGFPRIPEGSGPMSFGMGMNGQSVFVTNKFSVKQLIDHLALNLNFQITDKTGLTGDFAFMLHYTKEGPSLARQGTAASEVAGAGDLEVAPTIFTALQSQLGLKLEAHKGPVDVLIIDKAEKTPIEN
jgi:uncharacterized protein (TIGR03435 family)